MASGKTRFTPLSTATHDTPWSFLFYLLLPEKFKNKYTSEYEIHEKLVYFMVGV